MSRVTSHNTSGHSNSSSGSCNHSAEELIHRQLMTLYECRLRTFKTWPFDSSCRCNAEKMAAAGFYHIPTAQYPDAVRCFYCEKELDGWDKDDDPVKEMRTHAPYCRYPDLQQPYDTMTVQQVLEQECARHKDALRRRHEAWKNSVDSAADALLAEIDKQLEKLEAC